MSYFEIVFRAGYTMWLQRCVYMERCVSSKMGGRKKIPPEHKSCVKMEFGTREALESGGPEVCLVEHWPKRICT